MIDLDKLESRCKEASRNGYGKHPVIECASAESIMELITRLRQAEKDADRYRWLRDTACYSEWHTVGTADPSVWDVIVDEYINEATKRNGGDK